MRVTNNMMVNELLRNMNTNTRRLDESNRQLATSRRINLPSDDPAGLVKALRLRTNLTEGEQYLNNIGEATNFMETTDSALENINRILQRTRELTVQAANGTNSPADRKAISAEISQLNEQLKMVANTTYGTQHVFAGRNVTEPPCQGNTWVGDENDLNMEIGIGVKIPINLKMKDFFTGNSPYLNQVTITDGSVKSLTADNLQGGKYGLKTSELLAITTDAQLTEISASKHIQATAPGIFGTVAIAGLPITNPATLDTNASIQLTVAKVNTKTNEVTYSYIANEYNRDTGAYTRNIGQFTLQGGPAAANTVKMGELEVQVDNPILSGLSVGDKAVINLAAARNAGDTCDQVDINYNYTSNDGVNPMTGGEVQSFIFKDGVLDNKKTDFKFFSVDSNGLSYDSTINMDMNNFTPAEPVAYFNTKPGLFEMMDKLVQAVEAGDSQAINDSLGVIDGKVDDLLYKRATIGAKVNRLELQQNRLESTQTSFTELLSKIEDADMAEVIMQLKMQENVYNASLAAGAKIIQPSLVDFLR